MATLSPIYYNYSRASGGLNSISGYSASGNHSDTTFYYDVSGKDVQSFQISIPVHFWVNVDEMVRDVSVMPIVAGSTGYKISDYAASKYFEQTLRQGDNNITVSASFSGSHTFSGGELLAVWIHLDTTGNLGGNVSSLPTITIDGSGSGSGGSGGGESSSEIANFVKATPRSPSGSTIVNAQVPVEFSWSMSKNISSASYYGSSLQYRYGASGSRQNLGSTNYDISVLTYSNGFLKNSEIQWRVRTAVSVSGADLLGAGYTYAKLLAFGYEINGNSSSSQSSNSAPWVDEIIVDPADTTEQISAGSTYIIYSPWSEWTTFQVGEDKSYDASVTIIGPKDKRNGAEVIVFGYNIQSDGEITESQIEYSTDGGYNWINLATIEGKAATVKYSVPARTFSAGTIEWRARAKANGAYKDNWATARFEVTYDGYGKIVVQSGPVRKGVRQNTSISISAKLSPIGDIGDEITFNSAKFHWTSETGLNYTDLDMTVSGTTANIVVPADTFPEGLIRWYLSGTDGTNVTSETPVYTTYILTNVICSFPVFPVSVIRSLDDSLTFQWGYITEDGKTHTKAEIQFSEDGVNWEAPIEV